jgi:hypothetical protein
MKWTAIVINHRRGGHFSHSFSFVGSHDQKVAFEQAKELLEKPLYHNRDFFYDVIAIVAGDHPVYNPSMDS